jgi:hypothetical protein
VQFHRYFVSQYSKFCRHNPLCCFSSSFYFCCCLFRYRLSPETFRCTPVSFSVFKKVFQPKFCIHSLCHPSYPHSQPIIAS